MDANILNLQSLFHQQVSYRIPQFQRRYGWGEEVQWKPLWDDICNLALRVLTTNADVKVRSHFMGAIVLQQQQSNTGEVKKILVVDGQQRLTTLQLLIKATQQAFQSRDDSVRAIRLDELTEKVIGAANPTTRLKSGSPTSTIRAHFRKLSWALILITRAELGQ